MARPSAAIPTQMGDSHDRPFTYPATLYRPHTTTSVGASRWLARLPQSQHKRATHTIAPSRIPQPLFRPPTSTSVGASHWLARLPQSQHKGATHAVAPTLLVIRNCAPSASKTATVSDRATLFRPTHHDVGRGEPLARPPDAIPTQTGDSHGRPFTYPATLFRPHTTTSVGASRWLAHLPQSQHKRATHTAAPSRIPQPFSAPHTTTSVGASRWLARLPQSQRRGTTHTAAPSRIPHPHSAHTPRHR